MTAVGGLGHTLPYLIPDFMTATVLAIGATAVGRVLSVRRRGYELAALEAVGVSPRTLRRATAAAAGSSGPRSMQATIAPSI